MVCVAKEQEVLAYEKEILRYRINGTCPRARSLQRFVYSAYNVLDRALRRSPFVVMATDVGRYNLGLPPAITAMKPHPDHVDLMTLLTPTQFRVTILVGAGLKNSEIAQVIGTTEGVVKNFLRDIFARARMTNRVQLALRYTHELDTGQYNRDRLDGEFGALHPYVERALHSDAHNPPSY